MAIQLFHYEYGFWHIVFTPVQADVWTCTSWTNSSYGGGRHTWAQTLWPFAFIMSAAKPRGSARESSHALAISSRWVLEIGWPLSHFRFPILSARTLRENNMTLLQNPPWLAAFVLNAKGRKHRLICEAGLVHRADLPLDVFGLEWTYPAGTRAMPWS